MVQYYLIDKSGARLCKDHKLRGFAMFGTEAFCVKFYVQRKSAENKAKRHNLIVKELTDEQVIDASGKVTNIS